MQDEFKSDAILYFIRIIILALPIAYLAIVSPQILASTAEVYYSMGQAYMEQGKYDMAILALNKAVESSPDWAEAYNALGEAYVKLLKFDKALAQFNKAIELKPNYTEAKINQQRTTMSLDRYKPAKGSKFNPWQRFIILGLITVAIAATAAFIVYSYS